MRTKEKFELLNLGYDIAQDSEKTMLREKVKQLLEDLDKIRKKLCKRYSYNAWIVDDILAPVYSKVKQAFKDVIEDGE